MNNETLPGPELGIPEDKDSSCRACRGCGAGSGGFWSHPAVSMGASSSRSVSLLRLFVMLNVESIRLLLVVHVLLIMVALEDTSFPEIKIELFKVFATAFVMG